MFQSVVVILLLGFALFARTIFFTEDKDEVGSAVFEIRIQMCHEADEATLHGRALLRPVGYVSQRRENLKPGISTSAHHILKRFTSMEESYMFLNVSARFSVGSAALC